MHHFTIIISGKVQGVFYRASARQKAEELHIKGFVRNEFNGDVYIEAEAEEEILYKFVKWCNTGPAGARVDHVEVVPGEVIGFTSFDVKK